MANQYFRQFFNTLHVMPVLLDCNFIVDHSNGNGLGIRSLKGQGISAVYMNTSSTPAGPVNPTVGTILVQLDDSYYRDYGGFSGQVEPLSGSNISISGSSVLTVGAPYVITSLGTTTTAQWQAVGVPANVTPAPGVAFLASVTGSGTGTGTVQAPNNSQIVSIVEVGDGNLGVAAASANSPTGGYLILQCLAATNSTTTTLIPTAPADNTVISLKFYLSNSSVKIDGE